MIRLENLVVHIIDPLVGSGVFSEEEHPLDENIFEFMETHIEKAFLDINVKELEKIGNQQLLDDISSYKNGDLEFLKLAEDMGEKLYSLFATAELEGFDLFCTRFKKDKENFLGFFLLQYKTSYIHTIDYLDEKPINKIVKQIKSLPTENQRVDEFILFNLDNDEIILKEKKYNIDVQRDFILSTYLLKVDYPLSSKDKVDIINKTSKKIVKDYYNDDVNKLAEINSIMLNSVDEDNIINIDRITNEAFETNYDVQSAYVEEIEKKGLLERKVEVEGELTKRLPKFQKIILDDGIEIKIPIEFLNDNRKVEFLSNEDGSISIILKNLTDIKNK